LLFSWRIHLLFAYTDFVKIGGLNKEVDFSKLGPTLVIARSLVLAIRTARWIPNFTSTSSSPEWDAEVDHSIKIARRVLSNLIPQCPAMFQQKDVPWYQPSEDESPK
jgi:hypothetical protein